MPSNIEALTRVDLAFYPDTVNHWLRFGEPLHIEILDRRRSRAIFTPCAVFAYVRWQANEYGTQSWRCFILQATEPGHVVTGVAGVHPGARILVNVRGSTYSKRLLAFLDNLEKCAGNLCNVSPAYWRQVQLRLPLRIDPHPYDVAQWSRRHSGSDVLR